MRAVLFHEHGPADTLQLVTDQPIPEPGPGEVRIHVKAAALNYLDIWVRNGWPGIRLAYPHIPGADAAGVIDAVGDGVSGWSAGDRVGIDPTLSCGQCSFCRSGWQNRCVDFAILGEHVPGTYRDYITVPARNLIGLPEHVSFAESAAASLVFVTAWHSLITRGGPRPGETVLVVGAGVRREHRQHPVAKLVGCTVYVVGSTEDKLAQARAGRRRDDPVRRGRLVARGLPVHRQARRDVVVDNVGGRRSRTACAPRLVAGARRQSATPAARRSPSTIVSCSAST